MTYCFGKSYVDDVEVEFLLNSYESRISTLIEGVDKSVDERLATHSRTFKHEITKLLEVARERHELFEKLVTTSRNSIELNVKEFNDFFYQRVAET